MGLLLLGSTPATSQTRTVELKVIETSDVHGHFFPYDFIEGRELRGTLARANTYINRLRQQYGDRLLLIDNGDILQGQPCVYWTNYVMPEDENLAAQVINYMHFDAETVGNHDVETGHKVYDKWIRQKDHFYKGDEKRLLILSENGTSTPTYEESDQQLQAAGACWVWKKVKALDGIDAIQWHSWVDNEIEFGLRLGFRKYGTDPDDPYGKKKSWYVWQAAGTDKEDEVFEPYKAIIGINDWDEIFLK